MIEAEEAAAAAGRDLGEAAAAAAEAARGDLLARGEAERVERSHRQPEPAAAPPLYLTAGGGLFFDEVQVGAGRPRSLVNQPS